MKVVPVVIPFYRHRDKLDRCLAAIAAQTYTRTECFVRDNNLDNVYFTAAVNEGLAKFAWRDDVDHVLVLNQDAYLEPDALAHLVAQMDANPACGIAAPLQLSADKSEVNWGGSLEAFPYGRHHVGSLESYKAPVETLWANGAAMLLRVAMVREIGLLDKNLRFIASDADYSFTARAREWKVMVVPAARAVHELSSSARANTITLEDMRLDLIKVEDMLYFGEKWLSGGLYRALAVEGRLMNWVSTKWELNRLRTAHDQLVAQLDAGRLGL